MAEHFLTGAPHWLRRHGGKKGAYDEHEDRFYRTPEAAGHPIEVVRGSFVFELEFQNSLDGLDNMGGTCRSSDSDKWLPDFIARI